MEYFWGQGGWGPLSGLPSLHGSLQNQQIEYFAEPADRIFLEAGGVGAFSRALSGLPGLHGSLQKADRIFLGAGGLGPSPGLFQAFLAFTAPCRTSIFLKGVGAFQGSFRPSRLLAEPADRIFLGAGGLGPSSRKCMHTTVQHILDPVYKCYVYVLYA